MKNIRIACVICCSPVGQIRQNLDVMAGWVRQAKKDDAAIVCFPEMNITGYSTHEDIRRIAEPVAGPISNELKQLATGENIVILAGLAESDGAGRIYATHLAIRPNGKIDRYRKLHIAPPEQEIFTPGSDIPLIETHEITFGIQLCYDSHFPELSTHLALKGADLIFIPHASPRGTPGEKRRSWMRHLSARSFDNAVFVAATNQTGANRKGLRFPGLALVLDPSGDVIAENLNNRPGLLLADLNAGALSRVRSHRMRYFLPHRRTDLFGGNPL